MSDQGAAEASTPPLLVLPGDKDPPALLVVRPPAAAAASRKEESAILKLKGLPYTTTEQQILEFFNGFNVSSVAFVYEPDGRPSGLAFAEFQTREEALQAMARNGEYLGDRYVRLLHVPRQEMEEQVSMGTLAIPGQAAKLRQRMMGGWGGQDGGYMGDSSNPLVQAQLQAGHGGGMGGLYGGAAGMQLSMRGMPGIAPGMGPGLAMRGPGGMGPMGPMAGMAPDASMAAGANGLNGMVGANSGPYQALMYQMGNLSMGGGPQRAAPQMMAAAGPPMMAGPPPGGAYAATMLDAPPIAVIGTDSKTVKIRGLPFRATPLDILNFFEGYAYVPESLQLGVDALGRPSGEAWLTFDSSDEALRSVRERNRQYLGCRYLELSLT